MRPSKNNSLCQTLSEETKLTSEALNLHEDLLLHEVEAHSQQGHTHQQVNSANDEFAINGIVVLVTGALVQRVTRHEIAETDGQETGEAEVGPVDIAPAFPDAEEHSTADHEDQHHQKAALHRHRFRIHVFGFRFGFQSSALLQCTNQWNLLFKIEIWTSFNMACYCHRHATQHPLPLLLITKLQIDLSLSIEIS